MSYPPVIAFQWIQGDHGAMIELLAGDTGTWVVVRTLNNCDTNNREKRRVFSDFSRAVRSYEHFVRHYEQQVTEFG